MPAELLISSPQLNQPADATTQRIPNFVVGTSWTGAGTAPIRDTAPETDPLGSNAQSPELNPGSWTAALGAVAFTAFVVAVCLASAALMVAHLRRVEAARPPAPIIPLEGSAVQRGATLFAGTCAVCHGTNGEGKPNLGKDLAHSLFVAYTNDDSMVNFVKRGRPASDPLNTTKIPMPPKGNNPDLTEGQLKDIVLYIRALQDPRRAPAGSMVALAPPPPAPRTVVPRPAGVDSDATDAAEAIASGKVLFVSTCSACHGPDGRGLPKLGKNLVTSTFIAGLEDEALIAFVKRGRDAGDPLNTTKLQMPPRGGNPALDDDKLEDIVAFLRSIQKEGAAR